MTDKKNKGGRPTKYRPEMCQAVIEFGKEGKSRHEMALDLDIDYTTLLDWERKHEEFSHALKKSADHSRGWWEKTGRVATVGQVDGFNATSFIFNIKNRFPENWKDKQEVQKSGTTTNIIVNDAKDAKALGDLDDAE